RAPEQDRGAGKDEQCQGMAEDPGQAVPDDVANVGAARGDAGLRRDMVAFERVLHAEQKPQPKNSEHLSPACTTRPAIASAAKQSSFFLSAARWIASL